nr:immunoglobulin light chain junction region [Macaca mulatta]
DYYCQVWHSSSAVF